MKPLHWVGSSRDKLREFPEDVRREVGFSLEIAQRGGKALNAVPLIGFGNARVLEIISDDDGDTFRAVYTVRFRDAVYVLHVFKKKSKSGISTPKSDMALVRSRLKDAERHYEEHYEKERRKGAARRGTAHTRNR